MNEHSFDPRSHIDQIYRKAADSWWVFRHSIDPQGLPLPYGRVVYFAGSEQEVRHWIDQRAPRAAAG